MSALIPESITPDEGQHRRPRILILYATRMGSTAEIAEAIGDRLTERGFEVVVQPPGRLTRLSTFDAVVIGSAVYLRRWLPEAMRWLKAYAPELADRPTWLFQSGPCGSESPDPERVSRSVAKLAYAIGAEGPVTFGGRLDRQFVRNPLQRWVADGPLAGDYRDWDAITRWADTIAVRLGQQQKTPNTINQGATS